VADRLINRRDLDFMLHEWLQLDQLLRRPAFAEHTRETVDAVLDTSEQLAASLFLPHYKKADREEPRLTDDGVTVLPEIRPALAAYAEAGLIAAAFDADDGGLQLPQLVHSAAMGLFMAANTATAGYVMLTTANARLLMSHGTAAQKTAFAQPQVDGRALGTMCLSEPQAGSSLSDIKTRAVADGVDALGQRFRLFGNKMWISGGDHDITPNIVHLVLAKAPGPDGRLIAGTKGISLFAVPKLLPDGARNDVVVAGLNHKMGFRGTANCLLNFGEGTRHRPGDAAGAVGWLVGEVGQGLPIMFQMMNEARIGVGLGAAVLGYRGYLLSLDYARQRSQGRPVANKDPTAPQVPIIDHPDVRRMLLAQKAYAEGALALVLYCARLVDECKTADTEAERVDAEQLLGLLTPVAKTWPSEFALAANDLAIQVHGGYGYTRDFDVEQLYRDNRLNPIHEGTTGIQALDLLGRKLLRDGGAAMALLRSRVDATVAAAPGELAVHARALGVAWDGVAATVAQLGALNQGRALDNATPFLSAFGHTVVGWLWLDQAVAAGGDDPFHVGKRQACRWFFEFEMPKVAMHLALVASLTDVASTMPEMAF